MLTTDGLTFDDDTKDPLVTISAVGGNPCGAEDNGNMLRFTPRDGVSGGQSKCDFSVDCIIGRRGQDSDFLINDV